MTDTELIRKLDFFEPLDQKIIKRIASLCIVREFAAGEAIVRQGEAGLGLYFITAGRARVEVDRDGSKVVVAELKEGDFLGEFSIIDDKVRSASVICLHDTRCLLLTRDSFAKLMKKHPEIANQMLRTLVSRIRTANERIAQPAVRPPEASPPTPSIAAIGSGSTGQRLVAATEQMAEAIPKPQDFFRFYSSTKGKTQDFLNTLFGSLYAMKAAMRFSMAIVGCPVAVHAENPSAEVEEAAIHGVKLVLFPAGDDQTIRIEGIGDGHVSATFFRSRMARGISVVDVFRLEGPISQDEVVRVHLTAAKGFNLDLGRVQPENSLLPSLSPPEHRWVVTQANSPDRLL